MPLAAERMDKMGLDERQKALDAAIAKIQKDYGQGSIMKLGDSMNNMDVEVIPTGALSLDIALGVGGIPRGRIVEIYGPESSGKTTVALHMVAMAQQMGGIAGFIDAEHALDPKYARNLGVDIDNLYISQPDNGEQALEIAETMVRSGAMDIVIVDFRRSAGPQGGNRWGDGGLPCGVAGAPHVPGAEEADRSDQQVQMCRCVYQSAPREGRRHVWKSRDDDGWTRAEILCICPAGCTPYRDLETEQ